MGEGWIFVASWSWRAPRLVAAGGKLSQVWGSYEVNFNIHPYININGWMLVLCENCNYFMPIGHSTGKSRTCLENP